MPWRMKTSAFVLAVDTNVMVRFFADDDDLPSVQAKQLITETADRRIYLSMLVLAETFTVLTKVRKFPSAPVHEGYRMLLRSPTFSVENPQMVAMAIDAGERTKCGFTDALIALQNNAAGCETTATFDHRASRLDGMQRLEDLL